MILGCFYGDFMGDHLGFIICVMHFTSYHIYIYIPILVKGNSGNLYIWVHNTKLSSSILDGNIHPLYISCCLNIMSTACVVSSG